MGNETNARGPEMPQKLEIKEDERGKLIEIFKIPEAGQFVYITTKPGVTRGNHYHLRKIERFCVLQGDAEISMRRLFTDTVHTYRVSGQEPVYIDIPTFTSHNMKNVGKTLLETLFWSNEVFTLEDPDTFSEVV